jgi:nitric-oxide synthase
MPPASPEACPISSRELPTHPEGAKHSTGTDLDEAVEFIHQFHRENPGQGDPDVRVTQVKESIARTGTYDHTKDELTWGARVAWRNSARCIGRLYWSSLHVRDRRDVLDADEVAEQCRTHLRLAGNGGRIRPIITIFAPDRPERPGPRIWNEQLIRYAGYREADGTVLGDPRYLAFTDLVRDMGWQPPKHPSPFDVLPLVIESPGQAPGIYRLGRDDVLEVELSHPEFPWFAELRLRWHAVPAISNMRLRIGGVSYPAAPFNGWYMGTEIGARNLVDIDRYDIVETVADRLKLDRSNEQTLWRDTAVIEINRAVLHSFNAASVTITDHHTEARRFLTHIAREERAGRKCPADWSWIVPPISGGLTPVFHRYYDEHVAGPQFVTEPRIVTPVGHHRPLPPKPLKSAELSSPDESEPHRKRQRPKVRIRRHR